MLVSVTGGTGFVGAHSVAALVRAGHRVRLLVRAESGVGAALAPLGVDPAGVDLVVGDVVSDVDVRRLVAGADAVLHAASVYSFDSRRRAELLRVNERGTEVVLAEARRAGVGRTVHVSSVAALFPSRRRPLDAASPVGRPRSAYAASKAAAERVARRHQADGAPVAVTYPPALLGPHDPRLGDQTTRLLDTLRGRMPIWPTGGFPLGDVRDTAGLHARLLTGDGDDDDDRADGAGRHFAPGEYVTTGAYLDVLRGVTGRALPAVRLPAWSLLPVGAFADVLQRVWPWRLPVSYGAVHTCACATRVADHAAERGIPLAETVADTLRWLCREGHLSARAAGELLAPARSG